MNEGIVIYGVPDDPNNDRANQAINKLTSVSVDWVICPRSVSDLYRVPFLTDEKGGRHFGVEEIERFVSKRREAQLASNGII